MNDGFGLDDEDLDKLTPEEQTEVDRRAAANTEALKLPWIPRELPPE